MENRQYIYGQNIYRKDVHVDIISKSDENLTGRNIIIIYSLKQTINCKTGDLKSKNIEINDKNWSWTIII